MNCGDATALFGAHRPHGSPVDLTEDLNFSETAAETSLTLVSSYFVRSELVHEAYSQPLSVHKIPNRVFSSVSLAIASENEADDTNDNRHICGRDEYP